MIFDLNFFLIKALCFLAKNGTIKYKIKVGKNVFLPT